MTAIKNSFNKAAASYDTHCHLQQQTGETLIALIKKYRNESSHILDLGCGTGIVTAKLAKNFSYNTFLGVDIANQLLEKASALLHPLAIEIRETDFNQPFSLGKFNLIFSNMALHWSQNLPLTLEFIKKNLAKKGQLAFSIPLLGTFNEIKNTVAIQKFMTQSEVLNILTQQDYEIVATETTQISFTFSHLLTALRSIKKVGANYVKERDFHFSTIRQAIQSPQEKVLTYHIGFFIAHSI